ncbi:MAG: lipid II flippase MurJ [Patescibacteria group bacterium]
MVRKIFGFFYQGFLDKEINSLNQAAFLLGFFSLLSQFIGFLRDRLLAHMFGAGSELDVYYAAFRIPDFLFVSVASIVSLSVLVPFIIEKEAVGRHALHDFIDSIFSFFSILILGVAALVYFLMPQISQTLFKGFSPAALEDVIFISRLMLLSPIILGLSNLFGSLTQAYNRFLIYALAPILYNAGIVIGIMIFSQKLGILGAAIGVILGASLHLLVQVPFVWQSGLLPRLRLGFGGQASPDWRVIHSVVRISFPRTLTLSMSSVVLLFLVAMAARIASGSVSIISLSNNIQTISLSLIGVSYSLAAFPTLSRKFQEKDMKAFVEQMATSTRFIIFWSLPLTALLIVLRAQVVRVLLGSGLFDWGATRLTAAAVALFAISSLFQSLMLLFMRGFYSAGFTRKPFYVNLFSTLALGLITYYLLELFYRSNIFHLFITTLLKVEDLPSSAVLMLPLGFSLGTFLNTIILWYAFEREFPGFSQGIVRTLFEGVGAACIMGAVSYAGLNIFASFFNTDTLAGIFLQGFAAGILGIVAAVLVLIALKSPELSQVSRALRGRFWKTKVIATDPEII